MTGLKTIFAAMALAAIFSTPGDAQRVGKVNSPASSATEVSRQPPQSARLALVIGNSSYPDADAPLAQTVNDARALASGSSPARARTWHARSRVSKRKYGPIRLSWFTSQASVCSPAEKAT